MGISYYNCIVCFDRIIADCDPYSESCCGCDSLMCQKCASKNCYSWCKYGKECEFSDNNDHFICRICLKKDVDDRDLVKFLLEKLNWDRQIAVTSYYSKKKKILLK